MSPAAPDVRCALNGADGTACPHPVAAQAALPLCTDHLLAAHDWVTRDVGVTDLLPAPCLACGSRVGVRYPSGWLCAVCEWKVGDLPDEPGARPVVDVVYYIRFGALIKIGTSANPRRRIASLPHDEVLAFERGGRLLEQRRHRQFAEAQVNGGEWFRVNDALLAHLRDVGAGVEDPWHRYAFWVSRELAVRG
ncbi:GIY-YIG nuclease family protein [Rathayibacter sp. YIM 133350]|uniref:GIY-YIG nuclease family protein n=1 Tax=Rathayibacter sp. YIM 133350 TaxID=3131992 RepID=UPI00307F2572